MPETVSPRRTAESPSGSAWIGVESQFIGGWFIRPAAEAPILKRTEVELGGNNLCVLRRKADLDRAVDSAILGKFLLQARICMIANPFFAEVPSLTAENNPLGGEKNSGIGRSGGDWAIAAFTRDYWITIQQERLCVPQRQRNRRTLGRRINLAHGRKRRTL